MTALPPLLLRGDCLAELRRIPDASIDSVVTDPPYGLANTDPQHVVEALTKWAQGDRAFIPEGRGFMGKSWDAFVPPPAVWDEALRILKPGGHLLAFAGSRTFDLMTLSIRFAGFDIRDSIAWIHSQGFPIGDRLKSAIEPIALARKLGTGGGLQLQTSRIGTEIRTNAPAGNKAGGAAYNLSVAGMPQGAKARTVTGRHPSNVILDADQADILGSASRFFYVAKAPKSERPVVDGTAHPTVKPLALMRYLITLVTPPGGTVVDPFAGSGTTLEAAYLDGFDSIGCEMTPDYWPLIEARIERTTR